ncbi:MAG: competence/damage-inducible protein A [Polyangiaceae bacterium]|nr:competence/damage-inducible protein A [Polyangiaceae bacterium]
MTAAVLCIGTELTRGELADTNGPWLAARLTELGFQVARVEVVPDDEGEIVAALRRLSERASVLVCSGGLGPTTDDLTAAAVARALGVPLVCHEPSLEAIRRRFERAGREMSPSNSKQAELPEGAQALSNAAGTAPGFAAFIGDCRAYFTPGVPRELEHLWEAHIAPRLRSVAVVTSHQVRLRTFGLPESAVGEKLAGLEEQHAGLTLGYRASFPEVEVKVHVSATSQADARQTALVVAEEVRVRLGAAVYGEGGDTFPLAVGRALRSRGWRLAVAESCTGGLVGHLLTRAPASDFFVGGAIVYANSAKTRILGVNEETLRAHGAVSPEVARAMAEGIRRAAEADVALSVTGIAGPTGGTPEKPVGLVHWAVAHPGGTSVTTRVLTGDRGQIQRLAAYVGLSLVREIALEERSSSLLRVATSG